MIDIKWKVLRFYARLFVFYAVFVAILFYKNVVFM